METPNQKVHTLEELVKQNTSLHKEIEILRANIFELLGKLEMKHSIKFNDFLKGDIVIITLDNDLHTHVYHTSKINVVVDRKSVSKLLMSNEFINNRIVHKTIAEVKHEYIGQNYTTVLTLESK
jgi:hypothetical protein